MIRINLAPNIKRKAAKASRLTGVSKALPTTNVSRGSIYAIAMLLGWVAIGVVVYLVQESVNEDAASVQAEAAKLIAQSTEINQKINEEDLQARFNRYEELTAAVEQLETKRRTPVYVYHEIITILTTGKQPTINELEQRKRVDLDPQARLDLDWDANSVWLKSMVEADNGVLEITGGARDPDDLSEFVKRLRASARFARVSHPQFKLQEVKSGSASGSGTSTAKQDIKPGEARQNYYTFELTAQVRYWD
jgi:Tfp pilus assembly protein PilN